MEIPMGSQLGKPGLGGNIGISQTSLCTDTTWESCYTVTDPDSDVWDGV